MTAQKAEAKKSGLPPFSKHGEKHNLSTYTGRTKNFFEMFNPLLLFTTDKQLAEAKTLLEQFDKGDVDTSDTKMNSQLWHSKLLRDAIISKKPRAVGESRKGDRKIPMAFRMSGFVPMNLPMIFGMLLMPPHWGPFWQWCNQSYNVGINYANSNTNMTFRDLAPAYTFAVTVAISLNLGLNQQLKRAKHLSPTLKMVLRTSVPFIAVASAGASNVAVTRYQECRDGIPLYTDDSLTPDSEVPLHSSKIAGRRAVLQTALTRIVLPMPVLLVPGFVMRALSATKFVKARPILTLPLNFSVFCSILLVALPAACGLFPQVSSIETSHLECPFQDLSETRLYYNRGL